jgi:ABC-2 type transport system permease protein
MLRFNVIGWIFWRNVKSYFSGVLGYLIIVAFVTICALLAFSQTFFANNFASLDELSKVYAWLLLFLVPAITMGAWSEEHKTGTDVLLFTLPATTWEILLGKYFAVCAVYTVALLFSVTQLIALALLGQPDWSVVVSTYYGYWLAGLALLSVGLFASSLTRDAAVAFVLGMLFCSLPVLSSYFLQGQASLDLLTIQAQLNQYASGVVTLTSLFYFGGMILLFLYMNHIVISQRLWVRFGRPFMSMNFAVRCVALLTIVLAGFFLLERLSGRFPAYLDLTSERLYTLNKTTLAAIEGVDQQAGQVTIEAFISEEVPADFVPTKKQLETLLSQYERLGGGRVVLRKVMVTPTSEAATQAQEVGVEPISSQSTIGGKSVQQDVYLGLVVRTANGETVLPKFSAQDSIEYEITRAISALATKDTRLTIGVVDTDLHFAGLEIQGQTFDLGFARTKQELEKFYRLRRVNATLLQDYADLLMSQVDLETATTRGLTHRAIDPERAANLQEVKLPDVLMVAGVSSLDDAALGHVIEYIQHGRPVLLLDDPVPFMWPTYVSAGQIGVLRSPAQERLSPQAPFAVLNVSPAPKANLQPLEQTLGISWNPARIVWNTVSEPDAFQFPLLEMPMSELPAWPEGYGRRDRALVFFRNSGAGQAFNDQVPVSAGLRELLFIYSGTVSAAADNRFSFAPLVSTDPLAGWMDYDQYSENLQSVRQAFDRDLNRPVVRRTDQINPYTGLPERQLTNSVSSATSGNQAMAVAAKISGTPTEPRSVIVICDTDFVSDLAYECGQSLKSGLDNLHFLQNAIEHLAEKQDDSFIEIRSRRPQTRPLGKIEEVRRTAREQRVRRQAELEADLNQKLQEAQATLDQKTKELQENRDLSFVQRLQLTATAASEEQNRFDREMEKLQRDYRKQINELEVNEKKIIESQEHWTRFFAVLLPPLPALAIGISVILVRLSQQANARRKT